MPAASFPRLSEVLEVATRNLLGWAMLAGCALVAWLAHPREFARTGASGAAAPAAAGPGVLVLDLVDDTSQADIDAFAARHGLTLTYSSDVSADEALLRAEVPDLAAALAKVAGDPLVEVAEPELAMQAFGYPDDPLYAKQWSMPMIGAPIGWRAGGGRGVTVAVLDTGVSPVEDLAAERLLEGHVFVPSVKTSRDDQGHGTHVAGTIAQATHNGKGVVGVAPGVRVLPYKVLGGPSGGGTNDGIAAAIDHACDEGAHIINLSLGGPHSAVLTKAVHDAAARGVLVVAAAGNSGHEGLGSPADAVEAIGVSAVGPGGTLAPYSTWGAGVEIAAPGGDTSKPDGGILQDTIEGPDGHAYKAFQGTSMATPHVAGALAVLLSMGLAPEAATDALYAAAHDAGEAGFDTKYGHGRLDLSAAVRGVLLKRNAARALLAVLLALGLALLIGSTGPATVVVAAVGALTAGGLWMLPLAPLEPSALTHLLSLDLLRWPVPLLGVGALHNPVWASALLPVLVVFALGLFRGTGPLAAGLSLGLGVTLLAGASEHSLNAFSPGTLNTVWLLANGGVAVLGAALVLLARKLEYVK